MAPWRRSSEGVEDGHGLGVTAQLLQRQGLEELLKGADAARQGDKGVRHVLHGLLALGHRLGEDEVRAALKEDAGLVKEAGATPVRRPPSTLTVFTEPNRAAWGSTASKKGRMACL